MHFAHQKDRIDAAFHKISDLLEFLIRIVIRTSEQQSISKLGEFVLQSFEGSGKIAVRQGGENRGDRPGSARGQSPRCPVWHPPEALYHRGNAFAQLC